MLARARACRKPVIACFLGRNEPPADENGLQFARGTKDAALKAVLLTGIKQESLDLHPLNWPLIEEVRARLTPQQKYIRGLFCGGTPVRRSDVRRAGKIRRRVQQHSARSG
ncbi:membrane protein FdrA [Leclercia adecarboxylata]|uniref:Membrane protein FdrA n=1 Tax=Leclercia adecarboxylata TaxID=83655 RepID=A0A4U9IFJ9_9ENTR|nr:membrane protein FdrA [Leclercia adecarboxylata]